MDKWVSVGFLGSILYNIIILFLSYLSFNVVNWAEIFLKFFHQAFLTF
jgi:hypothetical protein